MTKSGDSWRVAIAPEIGVVKGHSQKPSAQELLDFLKKYYPDGEYHAVYESGFSGFSTYYALQDVGIDCISYMRRMYPQHNMRKR